jgi:hypothetical protein
MSKIILMLGSVAVLAMSNDVASAQRGEDSLGLWQINIINKAVKAPQAGNGQNMSPWTLTHGRTSAQRLDGARFYGGRFIFRQGRN